MNVKIGDQKQRIEMRVLPGLSHDCIIGRDLMEKWPELRPHIEAIEKLIGIGETSDEGERIVESSRPESSNTNDTKPIKTQKIKRGPDKVESKAGSKPEKSEKQESPVLKLDKAAERSRAYKNRIVSENKPKKQECVEKKEDPPISSSNKRRIRERTQYAAVLAAIREDLEKGKRADSEQSEGVKEYIKEKYCDSVANGIENLTTTPNIQHKILINEPLPKRQAMRKVPYQIRDKVDKILGDMATAGIIQKSESELSLPLQLVKKPNGDIRICIDYSELNKVTVKDANAVSSMEDLKVQVSRGKLLTKLDMASSYYQVPIRPEDRYLTAFRTDRGLYEYCCMPMGLSNAGATLQRLVQEVLQKLIEEKKCVFYMDDILAFTESGDLD